MTKILLLIGWVVLFCLIIFDLILSRSSDSTDKFLSHSRLFQLTVDSITRIFDGQGVSAAIITDNRGYWLGTSGNSKQGVPVKTDMLFNIGSIGKNFLAVLILQLAEEGLLSLDDQIRKWGLGSSNIDESITILQLLKHTSGIFDWATHQKSPFVIPYDQIDKSKIWTQDEIINKLPGRPYFSLGDGWHYSTTNYNLLKIIAEKITGVNVVDEIRNRFLIPYRLDHTIALKPDDQIPGQLEIAHSWFDVDGDGEIEDISGDSQSWIISMSPAMMYASAFDLAKWSQALFGGQILTESYHNQMLTFHRPTPNEPPLTGYGLGTAEIAVKGILRSYGHLGYHYGNMSAMLYFPKSKTSIVVLTNENNQPFQFGVFFGLLAVMFLWQARFILGSIFLLILTILEWRKSL